ncbi:hypothetical protein Afil01_55500 [Actinorhabdospora filicis]|uniref:LPXTG-motif cell wall-anchored protein n=1 Tax=Actinorhabdospora filicis TaxID=1785913 RepID=A0A9W6SRG7_9ACTN|nr:Ig-like domain-containing protein [Actinorhabdospora filicis]GLZ80743.1 hypothetical protein Afil01_55500 [Actinorhabdospora filicis]
MKTLPRLAAVLGTSAAFMLAAPAMASAADAPCGQIPVQFNAGTAETIEVAMNDWCHGGYGQQFGVSKITAVHGPGTFEITSNRSAFIYHPDAATAPGTEFEATAEVFDWNTGEELGTAQIIGFGWADTVEDDSYTVVAGQKLTGDVSDNDGKPFDKWSMVTDHPKHGSLELDQYGDFTYVPDAGFTGTDEFSYDGAIQSIIGQVTAPGKVTITVTGKAAPSSSAPAKPAADKGKDALAETGSPAPMIAGAGAGALALGGLGLWLARRRRAA